MTEEELYRFNERLAILGVMDQNPTPQEFRLANEDVQLYRESIAKQNQTKNHEKQDALET